MKTFYVIFIAIVLVACENSLTKKFNHIEKWKNEILETEHNFAVMAQKEGMNKAFLAYVADNGVLLRNDSIINGKKAISDYMKNATSKGLNWKPSFVDVSSSGDLGYTYGKYTYTYQDSTGKDITSTGIFHTVWKRQTDGSWKFVWD
ncbi:DUF4440 domain-containing protein [Aestuariivivens sp. NBU2969]|uniref:YybH family protein n=1 Tax=Aestuariivivens sp. NBU2969 TaxID=2873267 RepID=UPI001CBC55DF|nr:DUF4440 domain-containing protein [Aestuariivivens sp. NBU2969]